MIFTKKHRRKQSIISESNFEEFCKRNKIEFICLDKDEDGKKKFLKIYQGKSPDYWCRKDNKEIFVEVKTHTLLTSEKRNTKMIKTIQNKKDEGLSGSTLFEPFNPIPELKIPFGGYVKKATKKFKNIKEKYNFPRILLLDSFSIKDHDIPAVFAGLYPSFFQNGDHAGWSKKDYGILDSVGSVSAVVWWSKDQKKYLCLENSRAKIRFSKKIFKIFFIQYE